MANFTEKIGEKLHLGGHKKDPAYGEAGVPETGPCAGAPHAPVGAYGTEGQTHAPVGAYGTDGQVQPGAAHQGPLDKIKNKVKGGKPKTGGKGGDSSSSSESDGEGGRRKKKLGIF